MSLLHVIRIVFAIHWSGTPAQSAALCCRNRRSSDEDNGMKLRLLRSAHAARAGASAIGTGNPSANYVRRASIALS